MTLTERIKDSNLRVGDLVEFQNKEEKIQGLVLRGSAESLLLVDFETFQDEYFSQIVDVYPVKGPQLDDWHKQGFVTGKKSVAVAQYDYFRILRPCFDGIPLKL